MAIKELTRKPKAEEPPAQKSKYYEVPEIKSVEDVFVAVRYALINRMIDGNGIVPAAWLTEAQILETLNKLHKEYEKSKK